VKAHNGIAGNECTDAIAKHCLTRLWLWRALSASSSRR
jgi:hypothetical protein